MEHTRELVVLWTTFHPGRLGVSPFVYPWFSLAIVVFPILYSLNGFNVFTIYHMGLTWNSSDWSLWYCNVAIRDDESPWGGEREGAWYLRHGHKNGVDRTSSCTFTFDLSERYKSLDTYDVSSVPSRSHHPGGVCRISEVPYLDW